MQTQEEKSGDDFVPTYCGRWDVSSIPRHEIPETGTSRHIAYRIISDEMKLEGTPLLNMATFVTTWMEDEAERLILKGITKNLIDEDEYPQLKVIEERVIQMEANLFNSPKECTPVGVTTIGSSEAIMLALLAHKWNWRKKREDATKPNIIFGADVHTCWEKFARYFDVEMRVIPLTTNKWTIGANEVMQLVDENTIAIGAIVGTTYTGQIDDIQGINEALLQHKEKTGQDIPIHVDAASGGFIMPFTSPDYLWDFRLEQVRSINVSNHKFGLVYAGLGSLIFKDKSDLPEELPFKINYLGGSMDNYSLNFSKSSSILLAQYYNFLRFGKEGYRKIMTAIMENAHYLEDKLVQTGYFNLLTDTKYLPVVVVTLKPNLPFSAYDISDGLRKFGWIVPAYTLPAHADKTVVLRLVVKENFSRDLAEKLFQDILTVIDELKKAPRNTPVKSSQRGIC